MKKLFCYLIIISMLFSIFGTVSFAKSNIEPQTTSLITLRAGGGGSGGGGGGGGGGSGGGGSAHHSGTGSQTSRLGSILHFIITPFILFSSSIIFYIRLSKRSRKAKKLMKQMMQSDNVWKYKDIISTVNDGFIAIQTAWSSMDLSSAAQYLSSDLYDSFQVKLNWMDYRNQKNIIKNIQLVQALPVAVYDDADNSRDYIWFYIKGKMTDYIIDTNTQRKISGSTSPASFVEYWQFIRKEDSWVLNEILQKDETDQIPFAD